MSPKCTMKESAHECARRDTIGKGNPPLYRREGDFGYPNTIRDNRRRNGREGERARRRVIAKGRQASGNPPTPRAQDKSGQSDCPVMKERETPRYHAERETDKGFRTEVRADCRMAMRVRPKREVSHMIKI